MDNTQNKVLDEAGSDYSFDHEDNVELDVPAEVVESYDQPADPMTMEELRDFLINEGSLMDIMAYGYTAEDFSDPVMRGLWTQAMEKYIELGEYLDKVETYVAGDKGAC